MFLHLSVSHSVHREGGLQAHTRGGQGGVSRPTPSGVCVSQHAPRQTPPIRRLLLRAVCILLECILVNFLNLKMH